MSSPSTSLSMSFAITQSSLTVEALLDIASSHAGLKKDENRQFFGLYHRWGPHTLVFVDCTIPGRIVITSC